MEGICKRGKGAYLSSTQTIEVAEPWLQLPSCAVRSKETSDLCYCNLLERMHTSFHPPAANGRDQKKFMNEKGKQTNTVTNSCSSMASNQH